MQISELQSVKQRFGIIGNNALLNRAIDIAVQVANTDLSVLITGESGVGKETFPQIIHQYSYRKHNNFVAINCGAIPEGTIDSELFGHEKGSFTSAEKERKGYFEMADGGTIFLDEVGELPLTTQVRLLRVLETGEFMRVGSSKVQKTNVRVVAATNVNMQEAIQNNKFREDLYYRLNAVPIYVPPLRERKEDILLLFKRFAIDFAEKYNMPPIRLSEEAQILMQKYYWKGNIRQLKNITEQISVIEQDRDISSDILAKYLPDSEVRQMPALLTHSGNKKSFNDEREILYQVLFDMKKDVNDLKALVNNIIRQGNINLDDDSVYEVPVFDQEHETHIPTIIDRQTVPRKIGHTDEIQDTEEYTEESLSLEESERRMIKKALERHKKRKDAAKDLNISERTLYRKIKQYGLD
ncbi:MAG: sigma-54-dependent Fis family transcriptional regulator [Paludibacteraceae bacterium]|jgi:transcriptional regulator with PAS, ATPase and Fis domain|nr:sigma-54-dependent Fis family transcriptional regulator [Paludibacteraceae bacterium]